MSLRSAALGLVPEETARIARVAFPKGKMYPQGPRSTADGLHQIYRSPHRTHVVWGLRTEAQSAGPMAW